MFEPMKIVEVPYNIVPTGIWDLDNFKGGIRDTDFVVLSAGTGHGKSLTALWMAINAANKGSKTLYFDMENGPQLIDERLSSFHLPYHSLIDSGMLKFYTRPKNEGQTIRNIILDSHQQVEKFIFTKLDSIANAIKTLQPKLVVIDLFSNIFSGVVSLQKIPQLTYALGVGLADIAIENHCAILAVEQLKKDRVRGVRPNEGDIKGGSALTEKATKIMTLFNYFKDNKDKINRTPPDFDISKYMELIVVKDRTGDIPENIYLQVKRGGIKQASDMERAPYFNYIYSKEWGKHD